VGQRTKTAVFDLVRDSRGNFVPTPPDLNDSSFG
jgi:hypothetical protein